jgi:hypothetical protein
MRLLPCAVDVVDVNESQSIPTFASVMAVNARRCCRTTCLDCLPETMARLLSVAHLDMSWRLDLRAAEKERGSTTEFAMVVDVTASVASQLFQFSR